VASSSLTVLPWGWSAWSSRTSPDLQPACAGPESIAAQQTDNEGGCSVEGAGIVDVIDMANTMANRVQSAARAHF
jgi:hypothetical protein